MQSQSPISFKAAREAIAASKQKRDPFGIAHAFNHLSLADQDKVRDWFRDHAKGFVTLNSVIYAISNGKLSELKK